MSYYYFNRCPKSCMPQIEKLAEELGLDEVKGLSTEREWTGHVLKRRKKFDRELLVVYNPHSDRPLQIQTSDPVTHKQKDVKTILQKFIEIAHPTEISDVFSKYNLAEFE